MKSILKPLPFAVLLVGLLFFRSLAFGEEVWIDMNLDSAEAGSAPPIEKFQPGKDAHSLDSLYTTDRNNVVVVKDAPDFPGKALRFVKGSSEPRTPRAVFANNPGLLNSGKVRFSWESSLESFTPSGSFPGFESLLSFGLMDATGTPFFNFYYLVGKDQTSGVFGCLGEKVGSWGMGNRQKIEITVDFDAADVAIKIDDHEVGTVKFKPADGLRVVQFADGTGMAFYGSEFSAIVSNFKMTRL